MKKVGEWLIDVEDKIVDWLAGVEHRVDSETMSFKNKRHTGPKLLGVVALIFLVGMIAGSLIF